MYMTSLRVTTQEINWYLAKIALFNEAFRTISLLTPYLCPILTILLICFSWQKRVKKKKGSWRKLSVCRVGWDVVSRWINVRVRRRPCSRIWESFITFSTRWGKIMRPLLSSSGGEPWAEQRATERASVRGGISCWRTRRIYRFSFSQRFLGWLKIYKMFHPPARLHLPPCNIPNIE